MTLADPMTDPSSVMTDVTDCSDDAYRVLTSSNDGCDGFLRHGDRSSDRDGSDFHPSHLSPAEMTGVTDVTDSSNDESNRAHKRSYGRPVTSVTSKGFGMPEYLISTRVVEATCRCGRVVMKAIERGMPVTIDARPIDATEEIAALLEGRYTFARLRSGELVLRDAGKIRRGLVGVAIHAQHVCPPTTVQLDLFEGITT